MTEPSSNIEQRIPVSIQDELRTSYLDYAMSVIIGRALPDVRDGLKPVHRRILFSMHEQKINASGGFKKCARVVGDVLAKYHPHGDASVYDALVRLAQDFSMRHRLVEGQGNFGSVDGDPAAAYRYTECRLTRLSGELLTDLDKDTVDFQPNFDDSEEEPSVLPAKWPNLLVNGSEGIAVGMATNIPPHNLGEAVSGAIALARNPDVTTEELMQLIPGPDFPTGGTLYGKTGIEQAYRTGRGAVYIRAKTRIEPALGKGDREQIVCYEIPYQVNKAKLTKRIAELQRDKEIEGIAEVRDESDREGIRLVVELKKDVVPQVVLAQLHKLTDMQVTFGIINLAVVDGRPMVLSLKQTLAEFLAHRREVTTRRCRFELRQAESQRELNLGLGMATTEIDLVIRTIRESADPDVARERLMALPLHGLEAYVRRAGRPEAEIDEAKAVGQYFLTERQAKAILEMRLSRLTGLEQEKLAKEYGELSDEIAELRAILADERLLLDVIVKELEEVRDKYAEPRRTDIVAADAEINLEDLIQRRDMVVTVSNLGYIKRTAQADYQAQRRGGKGRLGIQSREEDYVSRLFVASTHAFVFFFTDKGKVYVKKVYEVPEAQRSAKGRAIVNFVGMEPGEKVAAVAIVPEFADDKFILTLTKNGLIKKTELKAYENYREKGIIGVKVEDGDALLSAEVTDGTCDMMIATRLGMSIRFSEEQVRPMGRDTMGVKGITLDEGDVVVGFVSTEPGREQVLAVCEKGFGKRTPLDDFRAQNRGGKGLILIDASDRNGPCVGILLVKDDDEIMVVTDQGQTLRTEVREIRETGRNAQGVRVMNVTDKERVVAIELMAEGEKTTDVTASELPSEPAPGAPEALEGGEGGDP